MSFVLCSQKLWSKNLRISNSVLKCYCSKPPEEPLKPKKPLTAKALTSRWHRRSLNPSARIMTMLKPDNQESENQNELKSEQVPDQPLAPKFRSKRTKLSVEDRVKSMLDEEK